MYNLEISHAADKTLASLHQAIRQRILFKISSLRLNPRPLGVKKLKGKTDHYRVRAGNYRIIYTIEDQKLIIHIIQIAHRKDVYKE